MDCLQYTTRPRCTNLRPLPFYSAHHDCFFGSNLSFDHRADEIHDNLGLSPEDDPELTEMKLDIDVDSIQRALRDADF